MIQKKMLFINLLIFLNMKRCCREFINGDVQPPCTNVDQNVNIS